MSYSIKPLSNVKAVIKVPADKSISHRALMISAISRGKTTIKPFLRSDDTMATLGCMKKLGVAAKLKDNTLTVEGNGIYFPKKTLVSLNAYESGTTMRILSGILAGQNFPVNFTGAPSLLRRPMSRIIAPLKKMGANIKGTRSLNQEELPPLVIRKARNLKGIRYKLSVASAQVKSALLFAGLYAEGKTTIAEPFISRDHTERMLKAFGAKIIVKGKTVTLVPGKQLISPKNIFVPGDFSSAAFFIVLGLITKHSSFTIRNVNINPTRAHLLTVLKRMGANIKITNKRFSPEPYADIKVSSSQLKATSVNKSEIPSMIDEVPILCVAAAFAKGKTIIKGVRELKVKETDRIVSMVKNLKLSGVAISDSAASGDWHIAINANGKLRYKPADFKSFGDHRTAMSMIVFGLALDKTSKIDDVKCIDKSFPDFLRIVDSLNYQKT